LKINTVFVLQMNYLYLNYLYRILLLLVHIWIEDDEDLELLDAIL
jgi:hypothetical protein